MLGPLTFLAVLFSIASLAAQDRPGYVDTPRIPGQPWRVHDAGRPHPPVVEPGPAPERPIAAPADAIRLFGGDEADLAQWRGRDGAAGWDVDPAAGTMTVNGTGDLETRQEFGDCQLHLEFATPATAKGDGQGRGNSGVFLMGRYEIQILDSHDNPTYADGQAAALYGQHPPEVNASRPPGEWQSFDIVFRAPRFDDEGRLLAPARVTVIHNGVVVQAGREFVGATRHRSAATYEPHPATGPLRLQDHGDPLRFRNIWIRALRDEG